jgi:3-methyladenine DNA glycosylase AlkD
MDKTILLDIKKRLRLRMNGDVSASMRKRGLPYGMNFGLDAMSLREVGAAYTPDVELANTLWQESSRECKILATMLYPKDSFGQGEADQWLESCFTTELLEQLCFNLLQHLPYANQLAEQWMNDPTEQRRSAGYLLLLRLLLAKKADSPGNDGLKNIRKDCQSDNYQLCLHATRLMDRLTVQ